MSQSETVENTAAQQGGIFAVSHPLIEHHLTTLRDVRTGPTEFRDLIHRLAVLLAYEATKDLKCKGVTVETPMSPYDGSMLMQRIGLVPILRAGLGMVDPVLNLIPNAEVWHLGVYRDERTLRPIEYYNKVGEAKPVDLAIILDPMLATGGSVLAALETLRGWSVPRVKVLSVIASRKGTEVVAQEFPDTEVYVCAIDETLNDNGYIVPGLGDAGDRIFNTFPGGS